jgi:hypothetical protein
MTSAVYNMPPIPPSTEWDKVHRAQQDADLLIDFIQWMQANKFLDFYKDPDKLVAKYFNIDLDALVYEQEAWEQFDRQMKKELGIDE